MKGSAEGEKPGVNAMKQNMFSESFVRGANFYFLCEKHNFEEIC